MSVSGPVSYMTGTVVGQIAQTLMDATRKISGQLGFSAAPKGKHLAYYE